MMFTPMRSLIASSRWDSCDGWITADSSSVSSTGCSKRMPVPCSFICRKRMSKAALWATSTVSAAKAWKAGSTLAIVGCPTSISGVMPWILVDASGSSRSGSTSWSKDSERSSLPLTMRVAPIWMISSPSDGLRPVVSVSKTVKASSDSSRSSSSWLTSVCLKRSKS